MYPIRRMKIRYFKMHHKILAFAVLAFSPHVSLVAQELPGTGLETPEVMAPADPPAPKPELERPTVWGEPTTVDMSMYVIDVDEVNSAGQNFAASV